VSGGRSERGVGTGGQARPRRSDVLPRMRRAASGSDRGGRNKGVHASQRAGETRRCTPETQRTWDMRRKSDFRRAPIDHFLVLGRKQGFSDKGAQSPTFKFSCPAESRQLEKGWRGRAHCSPHAATPPSGPIAPSATPRLPPTVRAVFPAHVSPAARRRAPARGRRPAGPASRADAGASGGAGAPGVGGAPPSGGRRGNAGRRS
jgi:hypothetical protein